MAGLLQFAEQFEELRCGEEVILQNDADINLALRQAAVSLIVTLRAGNFARRELTSIARLRRR